MQINGTSSGPTMAASEPPEPPPRNPDRINASLHKLSESKNIKSLDSSIATINEKTINNNKPLKPILSLDHGSGGASSNPILSGSVTTTTTATATTLTTFNTKSLTPASATTTTTANPSTASATPTLSSTANNPTNSITTLQSTSPSAAFVYSKRGVAAAASGSTPVTTLVAASAVTTPSDVIPSGAADSNSPLSSNGSNSNQTLISPMTIDNQQHRLSFPNKNEAHAALMAQQQQHLNGTNATTVALLNGVGSNAGSNALNANNPNANSATVSLVTTNHLNASTNAESPTKLREENERLNAEINRLRKLLENSPEGAVGGVDLSDSNSCGDAHSTDGSGGVPQLRVDRLEAELRSAKNQIMTLRIERKKLRTDKSELLAQVKQLCSSLQDKEQELRDFIRNFQDRVRETETNNAKLTGDRERERWQLLKQARDEAERSLALAQQLNARDLQLQRLQDQLQEARRQLSGCLSDQESLLSFAPLTPPSAASGLINQLTTTVTANSAMRTDDSGRGNSNSLSAFSSSLSGGSGATTGDRNSCSNDSGLRNSSDRESTGGDLNFSDGTCENGPCITVDPDSISLVSSQNIYQYGTPKERSPTLSPLNSAAYSRSVEQLGSPVESDGPGAVARKFPPKTGCTLSARNGRGGTWGSISRVFARSRNKNKALSADSAVELTPFLADADYSWSPLSEEGYAEKLRLLRDASQLPMERWRASQVLAWLEVALGMPQYSTRCAENVKSGKVLLELNDGELEAGLGLVHPMHRKKLRLAIEEQRRPEMVRYPMITQLGHTWVASEWLPDIGLPQYADSFLHSLVDARMLDTLSKKELEKFLGVTRKFHQASIVHGIHVLRIVKYDRQTLAMRRVQSENVDTDPIVWTNQRFIRWARSIDLGEYADNLKDSGVHGGLVVLEPSFSGDTMATALGIPPSKNIIRRHLTTEFDALILPARATLGQGIRSGCGIVPITGPGGLQHYATTDRRSNGALRISAWKGSQSSLSKAFRFNAKSSRSGSSIGDRSSFGNSTSPTPSYSSSEGGGGIYATIGGHPPHSAPLYPTTAHHFPPPTTAPPPPPPTSALGFGLHGSGANIFNYAPPGHRVSAPPVSSSSTADSMTDPDSLYEQHRRVKSISDIGISAGAAGSIVAGDDAAAAAACTTTTVTSVATTSQKSIGSMGSSCGGLGSGNGGGGGGCASGSSGSPV